MNRKIFCSDGSLVTLTFKEVEKAHRKKHPVEVEGCVLCAGIKARRSIKFLECLSEYAIFTGGDCKARWSVIVEPHIKESMIDEIARCGIYCPKPRTYVEGD